MHRLMRRATHGTIACVLALLLFLCPSETRSHTKGITLSRFGLLDISVTGNVAFVAFDDEEKVNFDKLGDRHEEGLQPHQLRYCHNRGTPHLSHEIRPLRRG